MNDYQKAKRELKKIASKYDLEWDETDAVMNDERVFLVSPPVPGLIAKSPVTVREILSGQLRSDTESITSR